MYLVKKYKLGLNTRESLFSLSTTLGDFYFISAVIYRTTELIFIITDLYNFASLDRLESFSTVRKWSMNSNSATTNLLRRW